MNTMILKSKKLWGGLLLLGAAAVLVACGGSGSPDQSTAVDGVKHALGRGGTGNAISWTPSAVTFSANPGARQDVPVTLKSDVALSNVSVSVVPELRALVSVTPTSISSLAPGQTATLMLSFAVRPSEALRRVEGTIHVKSGTSTVAKPLPVTLTLVAPESINGVAVPPEPPPALNNATLAGFDTNGNGVRDDVERVIATQFGISTQRLVFATQMAKTLQTMLVRPSHQTLTAHIETFRCVDEDVLIEDAIAVEKAMLSNKVRRQTYGVLTTGASFDGEGC